MNSINFGKKLGRRREAGFSLVEAVIVVAIALVLLAVATPNLIRSWKTYRLSTQASLIANQIDVTRFTAVRRDRIITLSYVVVNGNSILYVDANNNNALDATDPQVQLPRDIQITGGGFPGTGTMGPAYAAPTVMAPGSTIQINSRGTIQNGLGPYMFVVSYPAQPDYGFRAITITPMGQIKVWMAANNGTWKSSS